MKKATPIRDKKALTLSRKNKEIWKDIPGYKNHYQVSNLGRVRSKDRLVVVPYGNGFRNRNLKSKLLTISQSTGGYSVVALCKNGIEIQFKVHTLVLRTFCGKRPNGYDTRHINGNKQLNYLYNLKYGTKKENSADRIVHGTHNRGENNYSVKLTENSIRTILKYMQNTSPGPKRGKMAKKLAKHFSITREHIYQIFNRKVWRHV